MPASSQKCVNRKGQVDVNRSVLSAYGPLKRMSSFPRLNKIAQMCPCLTTAPTSHCSLASQPCHCKTSIALAAWEGLIRTDKRKLRSRYIKVAKAKEPASKIRWTLPHILGPPSRPLALPIPTSNIHHYLMRQSLIIIFAWMKQRAQCERSVSF